VVGNGHERTLSIVQVDTAGGVGQEHASNTQQLQHPHPVRDASRRIALIQVYAARQNTNRDVVDVAKDELSGMSNCCRAGPPRNFRVADLEWLLQL
jgi:hypothetical protein